ncbi:MAG: Bax inhibitor-1/YccA family protein [Puniceicoccales bacterium]|jgi:uncharacterized YccA/Bax inhibitor family protein|nr:Bax inhibitor-1/YccA family protein [Puniceicoccales bacterium]
MWYKSRPNPILSSRNFDDIELGSETVLQGTINRCLVLLTLVFVSAIFAWGSAGDLVVLGRRLTLFMIIGLAIFITACIKKEWSAVTAPLYAVFQGLFLGGISRLCEMLHPGVVFQAILLTFGIAFAMLILYRTGMIEVTRKFKMIMLSALSGVFALYVSSWILGPFGISIPLIHSSGIIGLAFTGFVIVIGALSLAIDFEAIVNFSDRKLPVYMSWFAAFGLIVGLIYLYWHILKMLVKLRGRN